MVEWSYYHRFKDINKRYLPATGEGDNRATQIVTAVNKLIYKWYNDGDVYDNRFWLTGWCNDLSSFANWIDQNTDFKGLRRISEDITTEDEYERLLKIMADWLLDPEKLAKAEELPTIGSVYKCEGRFEFEECEEEEDDWEEDDDWF